jgi:hypothetical protein
MRLRQLVVQRRKLRVALRQLREHVRRHLFALLQLAIRHADVRCIHDGHAHGDHGAASVVDGNEAAVLAHGVDRSRNGTRMLEAKQIRPVLPRRKHRHAQREHAFHFLREPAARQVGE